MSTAAPTATIPADIQNRIRKQIEAGEFADANEVLREAIDMLERRQRGL